MNGAVIAWIVVGGLMFLGLVFMAVREVPAMRREMRILRM